MKMKGKVPPLSEFVTCYARKMSINDTTQDPKHIYFFGVLKNGNSIPIPKWLYTEICDRNFLMDFVSAIERRKKKLTAS